MHEAADFNEETLQFLYGGIYGSCREDRFCHKERSSLKVRKEENSGTETVGCTKSGSQC